MEGTHYCWSQCCDLGPHACICGNDCGMTMTDDLRARLEEARRANEMSSEAPLTTAQVEDGFAQNEWDVDAQEEEAPRRERFRRWHAAELAKVWEEAYRQGIEDERTAEELRVDIGMGGYATANRANPYAEGGEREGGRDDDG